jgi:PST family polysaccharide transporter
VKLNKLIGALQGELVKSSFYSAIAALVKMVTAFAMSKILAVYLGPSGFGLTGQMSNFISIMLVLAGGALSSGIVKYVADYNANEPSKVPMLLSSGLRVVLYSGLVCGILLVVLSGYLSQKILHTPDFFYVFVIFGFTIVLYGLNTFLLAIVNGFKEYKKFNVISIQTSVLGLLLSYGFIYFFHVGGALIALVVNQSIIFFATLFLLRNDPWLIRTNFTGGINKQQLKNLSRFVLMTLVSTVCMPVAQMYVRGNIIKEFSLQDAGLWESINRISSLYLLFVTTSFSTYYLPRLSEINNDKDLRHEILKMYKVAIPFLLFSCSIIYFCRFIIIKILFTKQFLTAENLFLFQMVGDFMKMAAWVLGFQLVAKAMTKLYIITEILFSLSLVFLSLYFQQRFGLVGATYAFALNYTLYLIMMVIIFRKLLFK